MKLLCTRRILRPQTRTPAAKTPRARINGKTRRMKSVSHFSTPLASVHRFFRPQYFAESPASTLLFSRGTRRLRICLTDATTVGPTPWGPQQGDGGGGPKSPDVSKPDTKDLLQRMRKVDPNQSKRYRPAQPASNGVHRRAAIALAGCGRFRGAAPRAGDFIRKSAHASSVAASPVTPGVQTQATTICAFKFAGGVLVAGDRPCHRRQCGRLRPRRTKCWRSDSHSLMAIAGVPATAWEMARVLEHSFQFYRRSQLQEMSLEGKVRALSKLLRDNPQLRPPGRGRGRPHLRRLRGRRRNRPRLYFYDAMGAQFEAAISPPTGSGSPAVRSVLYYENTWGSKPLTKAP